jgi:hypothetical protein
MNARLARTVLYIAVGVVFGGISAWGYQALSPQYDPQKPVTLTGSLSRVEWANPHVWIHVEVLKADGSKEAWKVEGATPNNMLRRGLTRDVIARAGSVQVTGYAARDGSQVASGCELTLSNGTTTSIALTNACVR